jgi:hypothetical protein
MKITKSQLAETIKKEVSRLNKINLAESRIKLLNKELKMLKENLDDSDDPYYETNYQGKINMLDDPSVDKEYLKSQTAALIKKLQEFASGEILGWDEEEGYEKLGGNENMHQFMFRFGERLKNILDDPLTYSIY